ncbi:MAG: hypothetical protein JW838_09895 [Spirochaetes bacterium]|nr:hypothetical protein [Spirochaetota bacterium]
MKKGNHRLKHLQGALVAAAAASLILCLSHTALAATEGRFIAGPVLRYDWWSPFFENYMRGSGRGGSLVSTCDVNDSAFFYGPLLGYRFSERWRIEGIFLFSARNGYRADSRRFFALPGALVYEGRTLRFIDCYELQVAAVYSPARMLRVFAGVRSQLHQGSGSSIMLVGTGTEIFPLRPTARMIDYRAGLMAGAGSTFPLGAGFAVDMALTILCMPGEHRERGPVMNRYPFISFGGIGELALAFTPGSVGVTISLGGRYQALTQVPLPGADWSMAGTRPRCDQSGGLTASASFAL